MREVQLFSTCPQSKHYTAAEYVQQVRAVAQWSEATGCTGTLIYSDNSLIDPWIVAKLVVEATEHLSPLVAVQPAYRHPFAIATLVATFAAIYGRRVCLNMIAGGFRNDLVALGDMTAHDERYDRLIEYSEIIQRLLTGESVTYPGQHYQVNGLRLPPLMVSDLPIPMPLFLMSGSSPAARAAAIRLGITAIEYPEPANVIETNPAGLPFNRGIRVGIIADQDHSTAWQMAHARFPADRRGQIAQRMAVKVSDSSWHQALDRQARTTREDSPYWLWPYQNYATFCPYLVGDYQTVAIEIARYVRLGYKTFILDIPRSEHDLVVARAVFRQVEGLI